MVFRKARNVELLNDVFFDAGRRPEGRKPYRLEGTYASIESGGITHEPRRVVRRCISSMKDALAVKKEVVDTDGVFKQPVHVRYRHLKRCGALLAAW